MLKKIALAALIAGALVACGKKEEAAVPAAAPAVSEAAPAPVAAPAPAAPEAPASAASK